MKFSLKLLAFVPVCIIATVGRVDAQGPAATGPAAIASYEQTVREFNRALNVYTVRQRQFAEERRSAKLPLSRIQKDALTAIIADLRDIAAQKRGMAVQARCVAANYASRNPNALGVSAPCLHTLFVLHDRIRADLNDLNRAMAISDPEWFSKYPVEAQAIGYLYWDVMNMQGSTVNLARTGPSGVLIRHVLIDLADGTAIARALDQEAAALEDLAATMFNIAFNANEGPQDLGPFVSFPPPQ
jgi:hypothetical protein